MIVAGALESVVFRDFPSYSDIFQRQTRASRDVCRFCFRLGRKYHFVQVAKNNRGNFRQGQFGSQRPRAGNAILTPRWVCSISDFAPVSSKGIFVMHKHGHRFKCVLWAFTAFLFSRRATDAVFRKTRHLATFRRTDGRASANSRRTENGTPKICEGYGRAAGKVGNGRAQGDWHLSAKKFFLKKKKKAIGV